jgi:hypothetical protein
MIVSPSQENSSDPVEPQGGELFMSILPEERQPLIHAMTALCEGDSRRFCDLMWLGMGDRWKDVLKALAEARHIRILDGESADGIQVTDRGRVLAADLGRAWRRSA